jgi:predicted outer membrane repeat protein
MGPIGIAVRSVPAALALPIALVAFAPAAIAADWYVDASYASTGNCSTSTGSATQPFCRISRAILAASSGDTIHIAPGTYVQPLIVDHSLTFIGTQGAAVTIVTGQSGHLAMTIVAGVTVDLNGLSVIDGTDVSCGGVRIDAGATVSLEDCVLSGNQAWDPGSGEGAALQETQATVVLQRCTFASNTSRRNGGAIGITGGSVTILDCDFHDNLAQPFGVVNVAGGAIDIASSATVDIERTTFTGNEASPYTLNSITTQGGAIQGADFTAADCTFSGNNAYSGYGGAISGTRFTLLRCGFDGNRAFRGGAIDGSDFTATSCRFEGNVAPGYNSAGGSGGAICGFSGAQCVDCVFESNEAWAGDGGAIVMSGTAAAPATLTRCRVAGNLCTGSVFGGAPMGGGLHAFDYVTLTDCEIVGNEARDDVRSSAGIGGGVEVHASAGFVMTGCTVAGNLCTNTTGSITLGGYGGGIDVSLTNCDLDHCIVAGNFAQAASSAQDVAGPVRSIGWNDFGDTQFTNITGPGTGDLLDVDPLFVDALNGDFSLSSLSPCIDSGDPTRAPTGRDVANFPRFLDGDLDRVQVVDRGAHEFCNVALAISGSLTPGGSATLATSGTAGLPVLVIAGGATAELAVRPFGALFVDLSQPFVIFPFGTIPNAVVFNLGASLPVPLTVELQAVALSGSAGNLGNLLEVVIR